MSAQNIIDQVNEENELQQALIKKQREAKQIKITAILTFMVLVVILTIRIIYNYFLR
jgi:hypothetical protein